MSKAQMELEAFEPATDTIDITRTVKLPLETSQQKTRLVDAGIEAYQSVLAYMADYLPSYQEYEWEPHNTHMYHHAKRGLPELPDHLDGRGFKTTLAQQAQKQVAESFKSWRKRGKDGDNPKGDFGNGSYLSLRGDDVTIVPNDRGYGLKASFISYNPVWFHINGGQYQHEFLERVTDPDDPTTSGKAELHQTKGGNLAAHLTVTWPVETYSVEDIQTTVGVDLNDDPLTACAVWSDATEAVEGVELYSGAEFRHYRERMKARKDKAMADGDLKAIKESRHDYWKYTDHVTNVASRRVVDMAVEHAPCQITLEDLTHIRETATDPIHDWPFAEIQEKIISKAQEEGIPVTMIDPRNSSMTCRKCGETNPAMRADREFDCWECGYEVHADVNAAINIAKGGVV